MNDPQQNPYAAPSAPVSDQNGETELAGRGIRLGAVIIDTIIAMVLTVPIMFVSGFWSRAMSGGVGIGETLLWAAAGFVIFVLIQGYPLSQSGQTWGKKFLGIKIVTLDGAKPDIVTLLAKRYLPVHAVGNVPLIGSLLVLVDALMIFRDDRRCFHDQIAGTRVVNAR